MAQILPAAETAERWGARVRAEQHAASTPLIVVGCAVLVEALFRFRPDWAFASAGLYVYTTPGPLSLLLPLVAFLVLWIVMRVRRARSGLGMGRQGYGIVALATLALLVVVPIAVWFLGPLLPLGLGLVVLGWRGRERAQWITGLVLAALSPFANLYSFENHAAFLGPAPRSVVLTIAGLGVVGLGLWRLQAEHRVLAGDLPR